MEQFNLFLQFANILNDVNNQNEQRLRYRFLRDHSNPFEIPEVKFRKLFRLSREATINLINELEEFNLERERRNKIPFHLQVLIALNFYGQGCYQTSVGQDPNLAVSQSCVSRIINKISIYLGENLLPRYIKFPTTEEEITEFKRGFQTLFQFPNTIGAIDCTHIAIIAPHETKWHILIEKDTTVLMYNL